MTNNAIEQNNNNKNIINNSKKNIIMSKTKQCSKKRSVTEAWLKTKCSYETINIIKQNASEKKTSMYKQKVCNETRVNKHVTNHDNNKNII
jgi:hypothetical protein